MAELARNGKSARQQSEPQPFAPDQDSLIRRWAARFNLPPDEPIVVITAEVERIRAELIERLEKFEVDSQGAQQQWRDSLTQTNNTLSQALTLIQQQQTNQTDLTQTYSRLSDSLLKFEQALNTLETKINALPLSSTTSSRDSTIDLSSLQSEFKTMLTEIKSLKTKQQTMNDSLDDLKGNQQTSNFDRYFLGYLGFVGVSLGGGLLLGLLLGGLGEKSASEQARRFYEFNQNFIEACQKANKTTCNVRVP